MKKEITVQMLYEEFNDNGEIIAKHPLQPSTNG